VVKLLTLKTVATGIDQFVIDQFVIEQFVIEHKET
jgi:hypothetical protein